MKPGPLGTALYYFGRFLQVIAMWVLLVDIFMAGQMGPQPNPFYIGTAVFIAGWLLVRSQSRAS
jgi:hypothetical protein